MKEVNYHTYVADKNIYLVYVCPYMRRTTHSNKVSCILALSSVIIVGDLLLLSRTTIRWLLYGNVNPIWW
jgi:hypothetical protein